MNRGARWERKPRGAGLRDECTPRRGHIRGDIPAEGVLDRHGEQDPGKARGRGESNYEASPGAYTSKHLVFFSLITTKQLARNPSAECVRPQGQKHHQHRSFLTSPQMSGHTLVLAAVSLWSKHRPGQIREGSQTPPLDKGDTEVRGRGVHQMLGFIPALLSPLLCFTL